MKILSQKFFSSDCEHLFKAIVRYKNKEAAELFEILFKEEKDKANIKRYNMDYAFSGICENLNEVYDDLLWKFWIREDKKSNNSISYLEKKYPEKTEELKQKGLISFENPSTQWNSIYDFI